MKTYILYSQGSATSHRVSGDRFPKGEPRAGSPSPSIKKNHDQ